LGVVWITHEVPFQRSTSVRWNNDPSFHPPAAVQAEAEVHDTPSSTERVAPAGLGTVWIDQEVPSHRSMNIVSTPDAKLRPTAKHAVADGHEIPSTSTEVAPLGVGMVWIVQAEPSHRSAHRRPAPATVYEPTAVHADAELQDTARRIAAPVVGVADVCTDQVVPLKRSIRG
jgi:hypothetical protein